jgi:hypothetical protein
MLRSPTSRPLFCAALASTTLVACREDRPTPTAPRAEVSVPSAAEARAQPRQGPSRRDTPWRRMSNEDLARSVAEAGGRVAIGFKEPGAEEGVNDFGRVLVSPATVRAAKEDLRRLGISFEIEDRLIPAVVARISPSLVATLRANPRVEYVEPIVMGRRGQSTQDTSWGVLRVNAPQAWARSSGSGQRVLIIDSGIDPNHPDLTPVVRHGCDGTDGTPTAPHGTWVAGHARAVNNTFGLVGVAWGTELWSGKDGDVQPDPAFTATCVEFGRTNRTFAMNISSTFGVPHTRLTDQINGAYFQDSLLVVAIAGNVPGSDVDYPAQLDAAIAVVSADINNNVVGSNSGPKVELAAPGIDVRTTDFGGGYTTRSGTSHAAPHVTAAAALLKAYRPSWSNEEVRRRLGAGATDIGAPGRDNASGYGLLNIMGAIDAPLTPANIQCLEASCVALGGAYISHYTGANCTGTESYYTPYFGNDGIRRSWDGRGIAGTTLRTVTNRSYRDSNGTCHNAWPNGNTLSGFVTIYRVACGEAGCIGLGGAYISHYTHANCTGIESYYTPYFGSDGVRRSWDGRGIAGRMLRRMTNRSWRSSNGTCNNSWPNGHTLDDFVRIYRAECREASCVQLGGAYISHYTGSDCTGTESYYTPYFNSDGVRRSWDGAGIAGTTLRTVTNRSWRGGSGTCNNSWPNGNTLSGFVTIYR